MGLQCFQKPGRAGDFRRLTFQRQCRDATGKFRYRLMLHFRGQKWHQYFSHLAGEALFQRAQCFGKATRQQQSLFARKCGTQRLDFRFMFTQETRLFSLVKHLCFPVAIFTACLESRAFFFLQRDHCGHFRLLLPHCGRLFRSLARYGCQRFWRNRRGNDLNRLIVNMVGREVSQISADGKRAHSQAAFSSGMADAFAGSASRPEAVS
ncbi:hypothetical protein DK59_3120 [Brucella abortus bv. 4 str. 292]|nr:hypothetical protein DK59_3120 [Brucella abortus bv. 4 str. 292]